MNYHNVEFERSFGTSDQLPVSDLPEIAFAGRSNVGKSSMINKLFNRKQLARVSAVPGKTATINFFHADEIRFVDLPGYGYAKVSKSEKRRWGELIEGYFSQERDLRLVFQLIDMRHAPSADDLMMINFLIDHEVPFVLILTKKDKLTAKAQKERLQKFQTELPCAGQITMIPFSSQTGDGIEDVKEIIAEIEQDCAEEALYENEEEQEQETEWVNEPENE